MGISRRAALQTIAAAGATAALPRQVRAREARAPSPDAVSILYDSTRCIGCKDCIRACAVENTGSEHWGTENELSPTALTVLKKYDVWGEERALRKVQCMHCVDPGCVSACMLGAMHKDADGAVVWNSDLCVGCRYCQIACPYNIPRFEWDTPAPELRKCELCPERRAAGDQPACVEACTQGALVYGTRDEMLTEAHRRIRRNPDQYNPEVFGEDDGGGTQVLYLAAAGVPFTAMDLPELGTESVPSLPETIQHTLYKGFIAPLALFGLFGALVNRNAQKVKEAEVVHEHEHSEALGTKLFTWPFAVLFVLFLGGIASVALRFTAGLGAATNLSDGYPMGIWIAFDVVTGTALACGGYAVALLVYLANRGKYHPLVRAAIVTSALGYTLGGLSVLIDIGRAWNFYKIPLYFTEWNFNSILLEVALCIMLYTMVLWIELSPAFFEKWKDSELHGLKRVAVWLSPKMEKAMPWFIALGLLLPTMHQSSLGSLMLIAGHKLHPLWNTPLLPLLFLVSVVGMGYAAVALECCISAKVFNRPQETPMLRALGGPIAWVLLTYVALRTIDVVARGHLGTAFTFDAYGLLFQLEMVMFAVPAIELLRHRERAGPQFFVAVGTVVVLAGALYRFSTYLLAFNPGPEWAYFPALPEFAVTIGLVAAELMGYLFLVKKFPILRAVPSSEREQMPSPSAVPSPVGAS
ncbi:MAG: hydrogenase 2 operon protein HybA [Candidatus Longimicrobiales bacterium M2_2A_002]